MLLTSPDRPSYANGFAPRDGDSIDLSLWGSLASAWFPLLGATTDLRDISGRHMHGIRTGTTWVSGERGLELLFNQVADDFVAIPNPPASNTSFTVVAEANLTGDPAVESRQMILGGSNASRISLRFGTGRQYFETNAASAFKDWGASSETDGWRIWSWRFLSGTPVSFGRDKEFSLADTPASPTDWAWSGVTRLGSDDARREWSGGIRSVQIYNGWLPDAAINAIVDNPARLITPESQVLSVAEVAAGQPQLVNGGLVNRGLVNAGLVA